MDCPRCSNEPCQCKTFSKPVVRATFIRLAAGSSLEDFGHTRFDAIRLEAGRRWCAEHGQDTKAAQLQAELEPVLASLTPDDVRRILQAGA